MADRSLNERIDRLRELAPRVRNTDLTQRYGIAARTLYRFLQPGYYPTKKLDPAVEEQLRNAVEGLEADFGHDVPRETELAVEYESDDEIAASTIVMDIRSIRRLVTESADPVTRLSIIQVIEQHYVGRGQKIPNWLEELRRTALS